MDCGSAVRDHPQNSWPFSYQGQCLGLLGTVTSATIQAELILSVCRVVSHVHVFGEILVRRKWVQASGSDMDIMGELVL